MEYQVSARKYRPGVFQDVIGQDHVVQTLVNSVTTKRIAHAFLFSGTRGVGKTTVARILAKSLNCEHGPTGTPCNVCPNCVEITQGTSVDVIEIDGASNTSVDDVREVRENVKFAPFRGGYRIYIIDEVHMLSNSAFNALLKTLEEPPSHVVFVFATTEIHKIPATILSRCQHYNFRRISRAEIIQQLQRVAEGEGLAVEEGCLAALARASEGSMRDALSLLDQAVAFAGTVIRQHDVEILLGSVPQEHVQSMVAAIVDQDGPGAIRVIAQLLDQGHDLRAYCSDLVEHLRNLLVSSVVTAAQDLRAVMEVSGDELDQIRAHARRFTPEQLQELFRIFSHAEDSLRVTSHPRFVLEVAAVRATRLLGASVAGVRQSISAEAVAGKAPRREERCQDEAPGKLPGAKPTVVSPGDRAEVSGAQASGISGGAPQAPEEGKRADPVRAEGEAPSPQPRGAERQASDSSSGQVPPEPGDAGQPQQESGADASIGLEWEQVQERVAAAHPNIGSFLERGTLVGGQANVVTIGFSKADTVARGIIEKPDNLRTLTAVCAELTGRSVRVRVVELTDEESPLLRRAQTRASKAEEQKLVLLEQTRAHPLVKHALNIFGGDVVEVRRASPEKEGPE